MNVSNADLLSIIVPCLNEEDVIDVFYEKLTKEMSKINSLDYQVIFIEDGSYDRTLQIIKNLASSDDKVKYISFTRNFGKESAMRAGIEFATGNLFAIMDVDLQDPPELIKEMYHYIKNEDFECVCTKRLSRAGEPIVKRILAPIFYKLINIASPYKFVDGARDFRMFNLNVRNKILELREYNQFLKGIYSWLGFKTKWIDFENRTRVKGDSKWSLYKLSLYSIEAITSFSTVPLALASLLGILFCILSTLAIIFLSIRQLIYENSAYGWTSMICVIFFLSGIQLLCLGILGQYMSKIYLETKHRPLYIISDSNFLA